VGSLDRYLGKAKTWSIFNTKVKSIETCRVALMREIRLLIFILLNAFVVSTLRYCSKPHGFHSARRWKSPSAPWCLPSQLLRRPVLHSIYIQAHGPLNRLQWGNPYGLPAYSLLGGHYMDGYCNGPIHDPVLGDTSGNACYPINRNVSSVSLYDHYGYCEWF
jgi:hypothetical protein